MSDLLWFSLSALLFVATVLWAVQQRTRNAGWVDVFWACSVGIVAVGYLAMGDGRLLPRIAAGVVVALWSLRLAGYIAVRLAGKPEEGRYAAMREALGQKAGLVFLLFYWGQAIIAWAMAGAFWVIAEQQDYHPFALWLGMLIALVAVTGETVADRQLARFKARRDSAGKTCRDGLWRYSRHPNYFFEWLHWFCYPLIAIGAEHGVWLWALPVVMWIFLWFVTGIPYTERQAIKSRGDDYRRYQQTTSAFMPWRPRS